MNTSKDSNDWREKLMQVAGFSQEELSEASAEAKVEEAETEKRQKDKINIFVEKKGRGGKIATILTGFTCPDSELRRIASTLKNNMGCGGSCRDGEILLQGSRRDETVRELRRLGYKL